MERLPFAAAFSAMRAAKSVVGIAVLTLFLEPLGRGMVNTLLYKIFDGETMCEITQKYDMA